VNKKAFNFITNKKEIATYFVVFLIMLVLNRAKILEIKMPFASAFAFSMLYLNKSPLILSVCFFLSGIIFNFSIEQLISLLSVVSMLVLTGLIFKVLNKKINFTATIFACLFSQAGFIYFHLSSPIEMIIVIVSVIIAIMFLYVCTQIFSAFFVRGVQSRFTLDENICLSLFLIVCFAGISNIYCFSVNITNMIVVFIILLASRILSKTKTLYLAQLMGMGISVYLGNIITIAVFVTWAIFCVNLRDKHRGFSVIAIIIIDMVFGYFFNIYMEYSYLNLLANLSAGILFLCVPNKWLNIAQNYSYEYEGSLLEEFIITGQKQVLKNKLLRISELFSQMRTSYRNLSFSEIDNENAVKVLTDDVMFKYCKSCPNYKSCKEKEDIVFAINQLFKFGTEKEKVSVIDANNFLTKECVRINGLINEINNNLENYRDYKKDIKIDDENKVVVSEQLEGTSQILKELSGMVISGERINVEAGKILLDELTLNNIVLNEVMVVEDNNGVKKVILAIRNKDALLEQINDCLKSIFKINFVREECKMSRFAGWSILSFIPAPKYELSIGFACKSKEENAVSGDNYSFVNLGSDRLLFALSDGMGHGKSANEISSMALNLIENFYKAGFSSELILSSVNKLLLPYGGENFTTFDACVFDKKSGLVDFIKVGATCSIIKSENTSRLITLDSLPLGVIDNIKIVAKSCVLKNNDIVVLASDGVVDSFSCHEEYLNFVNNERAKNVQLLASIILEEANSRDIESKDDKTVIAFKVCYKI